MRRAVYLPVLLVLAGAVGFALTRSGVEVTSGRLALLVVPVFFVIFFGMVLEQRRGVEKINDAYSVMCEGRVLESLAALEQLAPQMSSPAPLFYIGHAQLLLWRVGDAVTRFEQFAARTGALNGVPGGAKLVAPSVALAHALLGNREAAARWLEKTPGPPMAKLAELVLACRAGDLPLAAKLLATHDALFDQLGGPHRALWQALMMYARVPGGRVDAVRLFRESSPDALKPVWPELHAFVLSENERIKSGA
ncbi:MAG: hypothetical protein JNK82_29100 [Myxococcaceae bacterium]|nr:hypothetical protein [Myxococcaceae bacterium]